MLVCSKCHHKLPLTNCHPPIATNQLPPTNCQYLVFSKWSDVRAGVAGSRQLNHQLSALVSGEVVNMWGYPALPFFSLNDDLATCEQNVAKLAR